MSPEEEIRDHRHPHHAFWCQYASGDDVARSRVSAFIIADAIAAITATSFSTLGQNVGKSRDSINRLPDFTAETFASRRLSLHRADYRQRQLAW